MSSPAMSHETVDAAEDRLLDAMRASDVDALGQLLAPELIFTTPEGLIISRDEDLGAHSSGTTKFESIAEISRSTLAFAGGAQTRSVVDVVVIDHGKRIEARLQYVRSWQRIAGRWMVGAGSATLAPAPNA
ncbi:hypothetical protein C5B94_15540 [Clavibacter michiganensis]|nr:hypothetical protein C5B94_15540 [Clavibacter michiganensis]